MNTAGQSHAPGPWRIEGQFDAEVSIEILDADGNVVFDLEPQSPDGWDEQSIRNAKLAVTAPELLEALKRARDGLSFDGQRYLAAIDAAIAKADGRS
jgi:hypothetical protein